MRKKHWLPTLGLGVKDELAPYSNLRAQIDALFDDWGTRNGGFDMRSDVSETDTEIRITAELPGMSDEDISVEISGNQMTISGEKKTELSETAPEGGKTDDKDAPAYHRIERYAGSFRRLMSFPFDIDPDTVAAEMKDGVLTVTVPKPAETADKKRRIAVKKAS